MTLQSDIVPAEEALQSIDGFVMIPNFLYEDARYRALPNDAKLLYGKLLGLLRLSAAESTGQWKCRGAAICQLFTTARGGTTELRAREIRHTVCRIAGTRLVAASAGNRQWQSKAILSQYAAPKGTERKLAPAGKFSMSHPNFKRVPA